MRFASVICFNGLALLPSQIRFEVHDLRESYPTTGQLRIIHQYAHDRDNMRMIEIERSTKTSPRAERCQNGKLECRSLDVG